MLVAFFRDSSYRWFDPAELIPFDRHFMEKSQQTNSRTFVKAVEVVIDEIARVTIFSWLRCLMEQQLWLVHYFSWLPMKAVHTDKLI